MPGNISITSNLAKFFVAAAIFLLAIHGKIEAQGDGPAPVFTGNVTEAVEIQSNQASYLVAVVDAQLIVKISNDGLQYSNYDFDRHGLQFAKVRGLQLVRPFGEEWVVTFAAFAEGADGIYALTNKVGGLALVSRVSFLGKELRGQAVRQVKSASLGPGKLRTVWTSGKNLYLRDWTIASGNGTVKRYDLTLDSVGLAVRQDISRDVLMVFTWTSGATTQFEILRLDGGEVERSQDDLGDFGPVQLTQSFGTDREFGVMLAAQGRALVLGFAGTTRTVTSQIDLSGPIVDFRLSAIGGSARLLIQGSKDILIGNVARLGLDPFNFVSAASTTVRSLRQNGNSWFLNIGALGLSTVHEILLASPEAK